MNGLIPPVITPYNDDLSIDYKGFSVLIEHLIDQGADSIIVGGTTGEYFLHTMEERVELIRTAHQVSGGRIPLIAGVGGIRTTDCISLGLAAKNIGVDGLMVSAPYYALPTQKELATHALEIEEKVDLPIVLYNYPGRTGTCMEFEFYERISKRSNFRAIKESSGQPHLVHMLVQNFPQLTLLCGTDDQALEHFAWGARGWVCGAGTAFPREHLALYKSIVLNDDIETGRAIMLTMLPLLEFLENFGKYTQCVKFACQIAGLPAGSVRPPLQTLSEQEQETLTDIIVEMKSTISGILHL